MWISTCSTCHRPATKVITGRTPANPKKWSTAYYSALSCDHCAPRHREQAEKAGPVTEQEFNSAGQEKLW
jgi:hypothetical protein